MPRDDSTDENPFVAFRKMADQQIASFFNSFGDGSSTTTQQSDGSGGDSLKKILKYNSDFLKHLEATEEAERHDNDPEKNSDEDRFKSWMTRQDLEEERRRLLKEGEAMVGPLMGMVSGALSRLFDSDITTVFPGFGWLNRVDDDSTYNSIMSDPKYSPEVLQDSSDPNTARFPWRAAFFDLLAEMDESWAMGDSNELPNSILRMIKEREQTDLPQTELEFYARQGHEESPNEDHDTVKRRTVEMPKARYEKPDILSTLTTTHHTTLPNGQITTKTVCKRRFSDGREEVEETINESRYTPNPSRAESSTPQVKTLGAKSNNSSAENKSNNSWFWSR